MHASNKVTLENLKEILSPTDIEDGDVKIPKYEAVRMGCEAFMRLILENVPDCADRSSALRAAREAQIWANCAIAMEGGS